jgi:hypothetical protein
MNTADAPGAQNVVTLLQCPGKKRAHSLTKYGNKEYQLRIQTSSWHICDVSEAKHSITIDSNSLFTSSCELEL